MGQNCVGQKTWKAELLTSFFYFVHLKRSNLFMFDWRQTAAASCAKSVLQI